MISLLARALLSKQPLTGLYFDVTITPDAFQLPENLLAEQADEAEPMFKAIKMRIIQSKDGTSVLYAEVRHDFVDLFFGLLCIPLGSIIKTYGQWSQNMSIDGLYRNIDESARTWMNKECQTVLLSPKLAPFFGCSSNVLQIEEMSPRSLTFRCFKCRVVEAA